MRGPRLAVSILVCCLGCPAALWAADTTPPSTPGLPKEGSSSNDLDYDVDGKYTVYWAAAADAESKISAYEVQERVGSAGAWTTLTSSRTSPNFAVSGRLDKTQYAYQVRARNGAGLWGAFSPVSDGILVDKTAPAPVTVTDDGATTPSTTTLHATWTPSSDPESGIALYQYLIRKDSTSGSILVKWTSVGLATDVTRSGLTLTVGKTHFIGVRAKNQAGLYSAISYSNGITVQAGGDAMPPTGTISINAGAASTSTTAVTLGLSATDDSGTVAQMQLSNDNVAYSTPEPYATSRPWTLSAGDGSKAVYAKFKDSTGNWSAPASDTIILDTTPPGAVTVADDGSTTGSTTQLHATWTASTDAGSGIAEYQYQIRQDSTAGALIRDWTSVGLATEVTATGLSLTVGTTYFIGVRARNGAGLFSTPGFSDGITVSGGGGTTVGGLITTNTTWTLAGSPYTVTSSITVYNNATLTIDPGVTVRFNAGTGLTLGSGSVGVLVAQGTAAQPITFTSSSATPAPGQWNGVNFATTTAASILDHCIVEYGGAGSYNANLRIASSTPTVQGSAIRASDGYGIYVTGTNVRPMLTANTLSSNGGYPLRLELVNFPSTLSGNTYTSNATQAIELLGGTVATNLTLPNEGIPYVVTSTIYLYKYQGLVTLTLPAGLILKFAAGTGLQVGGGVSSYPGALVAQGTATQPITFTSSSATPAPGQWAGLSFNGGTAASTFLDSCVIEYGGADFYDTNLRIDSSAPTIRRCTIRHSDGSGIRLYNSAPAIEHNTITANTQGIAVSFGTGVETIKHNAIIGNAASGMVNSGSAGLVARLNWWGHASGPSGIGPGTGSSITGAVLFEPWLGQPPTDPFNWTSALNEPDPFSQAGGVTTFFGSLPQSANWTTTIQDNSGAVVRTLTGTGTAVSQDWDGKDAAGAALPNGAYPFQMDATSVSGGSVAAPAVGSVTLNNALPLANITSPAPDQMLAAGSLNILGTAAGTAFGSYRVEYNSGVSPTSWLLIKSGTTPVTNGILATWNAAGLTGPIYTLRLTATSTSGQTASEQVTVRLLTFSSLFDSPDPFSPNGDGTKETTAISVSATFPVNWTLTIKDSSSTVARAYTGSGQAISQAWDGKNDGGAPVSDGLYTYQFQGTEPGSGVSTTSTAGQVTLDQTAPTAAITAPTQGQTFLTDVPVTFTGTATDASPSSFTLAYGAGTAPTLFTTLATSFTPVVNGTLYTLNPQGWTVGTYTFRLTVTDRAGTVTKLDRQVVFDHIQVSAVSVSPFAVDPYNGEQAGITYTLSRSADVTVRVYDAPTKQLVRTLTAAGQAGGANTTFWDGRTGGGSVAPLEAYYFTIEAVDPANANRKGSYNNATAPLVGPLPFTSNHAVNATNFDPYRNDLVQINYTFSAPGRLSIKIYDANKATIRTLINQALRPAGSSTEFWDGRRDDGRIYRGSFSVFFDVPVALPLNPIRLRRAPAEFSNFRAEAYVIQPTFGEVSTLTYTLSRAATVTLTLTDPNGNMVRTLRSNAPQPAGAQTVEWDGRTDAGTVVSVEGDYRVTFTALDAVSGLSSTRLGTVTVYR